VAGIGEGGPYPWHYLHRRAVTDAANQFDRARGVAHAVERLRVRLLPSRKKLRVFLLNMRHIGEHHFAQITCRRCRVNALPVPIAHEERQPPGVIDVHMRNNDGVDMRDIERNVLILPLNARAPPLKESAIQENGLAVNAYDVA
jgi:hypothetical protein